VKNNTPPPLLSAFAPLAISLFKGGKYREAIDYLQSFRHLFPRHPAIPASIAGAYLELGDFAMARTHIGEALDLPNSEDLKIDQAEIERRDGQLFRASHILKKYLQQKPQSYKALANLAIVNIDMRNYEEAERLFGKALLYAPDNPTIHFNYANLLMLLDRYSEAWPHWEYRRYTDDWPKFPSPEWTGQPLAGKTLYIRTEQGHGDTIQFARYIHHLAEAVKPGGQIIIHCDHPMLPILEVVFFDCSVISGDKKIEAGTIDYSIMLMSIPQHFDLIPNVVPYMVYPTDISFKARFPRSNIFFVWKGSHLNKNDRHRSIPWEIFSQISTVRASRFQNDFHSLQFEHDEDLFGIHDWRSNISSWADTAYYIAQADLVITVETAVAHLAGAMGKPVWVLVPYNADWRWGRDEHWGERSLWYPTARLFRQPVLGDWKSVIEKVSSELYTYF
jgi:hypothetical protein